MRHLLHLLITLTLCLITTLSASAQGKSYVGYSDGKIASSTSGKYSSFGSTGSSVSTAIRLPKSTLAAYKGCRLIGVNYGMPTSQGVPRLNGWVRATKDGKNISEGTTTSTNYGWREISVTPYTITGEEDELWIGATYVNESKAYVAVSFAGPPVTDGCYVDNGSGWANYASQGWGSLSLEAIIEGENVATRDLALLNVTPRQRSIQVGEPISVSGIIKNNASETAVKPVINYSINGQHIGQYVHNENIAFRQSANFNIDIPTTLFNEAITANVTLSLEWSDGSTDDAPADNTVNFSVELAKEVFKRRMVVEEHTGAWCGWCVRGIVALKEMKAAHGDDFIGIAIHNKDEYVVADYDNFISAYTDGFPSSTINRSGSHVDPTYTNLSGKYMAMNAQADADITLEAAYDTNGQFNFTAHSHFAFNVTDADYRVAFVVLENQLPITQLNFYSGSSSVMGGFELLGKEVNINIDDVARGIYPSPSGNKGSIPANVTKGIVYDYSYTTKAPFENGQNLEIVALLIDAKTGEIVNANKTTDIVGITSGTPIDPVNPGGGEEPNPIVSLTHTFSPESGTTVETLDKVIVNFQGTYAEEGMNHVGYYNYQAPVYGFQQVPIESRPYLRDDNGNIVKKISRVMWTYNPAYTGLASMEDPYNYNEFELAFDGVPAGHYTLVIPKNFFVYYDSEKYLCGTKEFTAEYTVTKGKKATLDSYDVRFSPAEYSELREWNVVTLYSSDDIYNYYNSDLSSYYNYFYVETPQRPYVILPNGQQSEVKYADYVETTGGFSNEVMLQLTFNPSYAQGTYTLVIPDDYLVVCDTSKGTSRWEGYAAPERRFTFFVGAAPESIAAPTTTPDEHEANPIYNLWGKTTTQQKGIVITNGKKILR